MRLNDGKGKIAMQMGWHRGVVGAERSLKRHVGRFGPTAEKGLKRKKGFGKKAAAEVCKCPKCGREEPKIPGVRCEQIHCPECNVPLQEE